VCIMFVCDREERECGVGSGVNATMLSATLAIISLVGKVSYRSVSGLTGTGSSR
jgi:hypothetical protein